MMDEMVKEEQVDVPPGFAKLPEPENVCKRKQLKRYRFPGFQRARRELPVELMTHELDLQCDFNQAIANLNAKHGAVDKDCNLSSDSMKKLSLFGIWKTLNELRNKSLEELELSLLQPYYNIVEDAEKLNIYMKWLHERLDEMKDTIVSRNDVRILQAVKRDYIKRRDEKKETLKRLQVEVKKVEDEMSLDNEMIDEVDVEIKKRVAKLQEFQRRPLLGGHELTSLYMEKV